MQYNSPKMLQVLPTVAYSVYLTANASISDLLFMLTVKSSCSLHSIRFARDGGDGNANVSAGDRIGLDSVSVKVNIITEVQKTPTAVELFMENTNSMSNLISPLVFE